MTATKLYYERTLPHWQPEGRSLFLTWRLSGSLPSAISQFLKASGTKELGKRFREFDRKLGGAACGPKYLNDPRIASLVVSGIRKVENVGLCHAVAWVVMPNHVHLLMQPHSCMAVITKAIKGGSARRANVLLGRIGKPFWQDESFDHWIRDDAEFVKVKQYIERNPVMAGLVSKEQDWRWSSAYRGEESDTD